VLAEAERSGGTIAKPNERASWNVYAGYFADAEGISGRWGAGEGQQT
jgi:hypothetical protein